MPGSDPTHWLHRLSAAEWLAAAENEVRDAEAALSRRAPRPGITHARRAAGMAFNAVLVASPPSDDRYGRSYMDHLHAAVEDTALPDEIRAAAGRLCDTAPRPPELVQLGPPDLAAAEAARAILQYARQRIG